MPSADNAMLAYQDNFLCQEGSEYNQNNDNIDNDNMDNTEQWFDLKRSSNNERQ